MYMMQGETEITKTDRRVKIACYIAISISAILIALYFIFFHYGFSKESNSWSNFGDYFNGVLSPILTAVNIYVFIRLTTTISNIESKRAQEAINQEKFRSDRELNQAKELFEKELEHDKIRLEIELENEKKLLLLQLRKQEIDSFLKVMNDILVFEKQHDINELAYPILRAYQYTESLLFTGVKIFGIEKNYNLISKIHRLSRDLDILYNELKINKNIDQDIHLRIFEEKREILDALIDITLDKRKE